MESQIVSANTFPTEDYSESFFASVPTDARFLSTSFQKISPESSIQGKTITFTLGRYTAGNVYLIQAISYKQQTFLWQSKWQILTLIKYGCKMLRKCLNAYN